MDLTLIIADGSESGRADPAYAATRPAHRTLGDGSMECWLPIQELGRLAARSVAKLTNAAKPWSNVRGPGTAVVASCARIGWKVRDAATLVTDKGKDPAPGPRLTPGGKSGRMRVGQTVEVETGRVAHTAAPDQGGRGGRRHGGSMEDPQQQKLHPVLGQQAQSCLPVGLYQPSMAPGRLFQAGLAEHPKCMACFAAELRARGGTWPPQPGCTIAEAALAAAPHGTMIHRNWLCSNSADLRKQHAPQCMADLAGSNEVHGTPAFERGLFPSLSPTVPPPSTHPTFIWDVFPPGGHYEGTIYTDGSRLDGDDPRTGRNGWSFVVKNDTGRTLAAAYGVPPDWVDDIPGSEAWAVKEAATGALPGCVLRVDCQPCVDAFKAGLEWATGDKRKHARVHKLMLQAWDDFDPEGISMDAGPHHRGQCGGGGAGRRHQAHNTRPPRQCARRPTGKAGGEHPPGTGKHQNRLKQQRQLVKETVQWIGLANYEANNQTEPRTRDTTANRAATRRAKKERARARAAALAAKALEPKRPVRVAARPWELGGHAIDAASREAGVAEYAAPEQASGTTLHQSDAKGQQQRHGQSGGSIQRERRAAGSQPPQDAVGRHHLVPQMRSIWGREGNRLAATVHGESSSKLERGKMVHNTTGRFINLLLLKSGKHPETRLPMPPAIPELLGGEPSAQSASKQPDQRSTWPQTQR